MDPRNMNGYLLANRHMFPQLLRAVVHLFGAIFESSIFYKRLIKTNVSK